MSERRPSAAPAPFGALGRKYNRFALLLLALGFGLLSQGQAGSAVSLIVASAVCVFVGRRLGTSGNVVQATHRSLDLLQRGRVDEAATALETIAPSERKAGSVGRAFALQQAMIALHRGDLAHAEARATEALGLPMGLLTKVAERAQNSLAFAIRAEARAALGATDEALADAARAEENGTPEALARAALARAVVLSRGGATDELREHLAKTSPVMLDHLNLQERSLLRALRRLARKRARSVYREPAELEVSSEPNATASWIAKIAPEAASFAEDLGARIDAAEGVAIPAVGAPAEAERALAASRKTAETKGGRRALTRVFGVWLALVVVFLALWQFLADASAAPVAVPGVLSPAMIVVFAVTLAAAIAGAKSYRAHGQSGRLLRATSLAARGEIKVAGAELARLAASPVDTIAAGACLALADLEDRARGFEAVLAWSEAGLGRTLRSTAVKAVSSFAVTPGLKGKRAFALAALGREAEAKAELAALVREHPSFALAARTHLRVRLVLALRAGDLEGARAIARDRAPSLSLSLRDELLCDVVSIVGGEPMRDDDVERVASELELVEGTAAWVESFVPDARARIAARFEGVRVADRTSEASEEIASEDGALEEPPLRRERVRGARDAE